MTIAISLMSIGLIAQASFGEIKGKVLDKETKEPVPFSNVYVMSNGNAVGTVTNIDGEFKIKPLPAGTYDLVVSNVEYGTTTLPGIIVQTEQIAFAGEILISNGNVIKVLDVSAVKLINPEETSLVTTSWEQIKNSPTRTNINRIAGDGNSNVQVSEDGNEIYFRGSRNGDVLYIVDGVKITGGRPILPSQGINRMSVYTGGVPAKYGDTMGGVVVVETKSYFDLYYESLRK